MEIKPSFVTFDKCLNYGGFRVLKPINAIKLPSVDQLMLSRDRTAKGTWWS